MHTLITKTKQFFVKKHKKSLLKCSQDFKSYPEVGLIFQTFNKSQNIKFFLKPFTQNKFKNIILFADGCIDLTSFKAHSILNGRCHYVIQTNDTHEIKNYRDGIHLLKSLGCEFAMLLQDDDIYTDGIVSWLDAALGIMKTDHAIAIVGGAGGANYEPDFCRQADYGLMNAEFEAWTKDGKKGFRLGHYQSMINSGAKPSLHEFSMEYVATVNRAPQIVRISAALELGFFPCELEPFQYDDDYNCLLAWSSGQKILHMPTSCKIGNVGIGGMRLYNSVTRRSRPEHFIPNWNFVLHNFGDAINNGQINHMVKLANGAT